MGSGPRWTCPSRASPRQVKSQARTVSIRLQGCSVCLLNGDFGARRVRYLEIWVLSATLIDSSSEAHSPLSDFSAARTSPWDKPNCRAIRVGVMPALKAARTAFSCPRVNETGASTFRLGERLSVGVVSLPLRFASASVTTSRRSSSSSLRCLTALGRSLGKTCGLAFADEAGFVAGGDVFSTPAAENRSDLHWLVCSRPMSG